MQVSGRKQVFLAKTAVRILQMDPVEGYTEITVYLHIYFKSLQKIYCCEKNFNVLSISQ